MAGDWIVNGMLSICRRMNQNCPISRLAALALAITLAGCGGMNRAVVTLPNTFDDLGAKTAPLRAGRADENRDERPRRP